MAPFFLHIANKIEFLKPILSKGHSPDSAVFLPLSDPSQEMEIVHAHECVDAHLAGMMAQARPANDARMPHLHSLHTWAFSTWVVREHGCAARGTYLRLAREMERKSFSDSHHSRCLEQAVRAGEDERKDRRSKKRGAGAKGRRQRGNEREGNGLCGPKSHQSA